MRHAAYYILKAFRNLRENLFINIINTGTITLSLLILASYLLVYYNLQGLFKNWTNKIQVVAYIKEDMPPQELNYLKRRMEKKPQVQEVIYVSKEEALARFREDLGEFRSYLEGLAENPLPASFHIRLKPFYRSPDGVKAAVNALSAFPEIQEFQFGQRWLENLAAFLRLLQIGGVFFGVLVFLATSVIISNTIRLAIYARRDEIEIVKLAGATNAFVKIPFHIEGFLLGLGGGFLALGILYTSYCVLIWKTASWNQVLNLKGIAFLPPEYWGLLLLCGGLVGLLGSAVSLKRFMIV